MSDMNIFLREMLFMTYYQDQIHRSEKARLIHQIHDNQTSPTPIHCRMLVGLGKCLVTLGLGLQGRFDTNAQHATM